MRKGVTLPELLIVVIIVGLLATLAFPLVRRTLDRAAVSGAATEAAGLLSRARHLAIARRATTAVRFESTGMVTVFTGLDTIVRRDLHGVHRVALSATRDSIAFGPTGRGYGAANTTIVVSRGGAADTVVVSRLGRVRRR